MYLSLIIIAKQGVFDKDANGKIIFLGGENGSLLSDIVDRIIRQLAYCLVHFGAPARLSIDLRRFFLISEGPAQRLTGPDIKNIPHCYCIIALLSFRALILDLHNVLLLGLTNALDLIKFYCEDLIISVK